MTSIGIWKPCNTSVPRLSADDVMARGKLFQYQNTYAVAMKSFGLQRGVVGSTARHKTNSQYYREQMLKYEEDIERLHAEVEKAREGGGNYGSINQVMLSPFSHQW